MLRRIVPITLFSLVAVPVINLGSVALADPATEGEWEALLDSSNSGWGIFPREAVHTILLKNKKLLCINPYNDIWLYDPDPTTNPNHEIELLDPPLYPGTSDDIVIFCSGHCQLSNGRVFFAGGGGKYDTDAHAKTVLFDPDDNSWEVVDDLPTGKRWYPTCITLWNGKVLVVGGGYNDSSGNKNKPVVFDVSASPQYTTLNAEWHFPWYPETFLLGDGTVFVAGSAWYPNPDPSCAFVPCGGTCPPSTRKLNMGIPMWTEVDVAAIASCSAVMYRPNRIMMAGGYADETGCSSSSAEVTDTVLRINMADDTLEWTPAAHMNYARNDFYLVAMPDGKVFAVGGAGAGTSAVLAGEMYDATSNTWITMDSMSAPRLYHSSAVLLPDGRVFIAGGEGPNGTEYSAQTFKAPYLFQTTPTRPTIVSAPTPIYYGAGFDVTTGNNQAHGITAVSLMRLGAATHSFDHNQRYVPLTFTAPSQNTLRVAVPANAHIAPPGYYMLFILADGVPSISAMVQVLPPP